MVNVCQIIDILMSEKNKMNRYVCYNQVSPMHINIFD